MSSRKKINLKTLPKWMQYSISISVVIIISTFAWLLDKDKPIPNWIETGLVPALGWLFLFLLAVAITGKIVKK